MESVFTLCRLALHSVFVCLGPLGRKRLRAAVAKKLKKEKFNMGNRKKVAIIAVLLMVAGIVLYVYLGEKADELKGKTDSNGAECRAWRRRDLTTRRTGVLSHVRRLESS